MSVPPAAADGALRRRGCALEYATLGWNVVGVVMLGVAAWSARSVALAGFGLDSLIEIGASIVVVWDLSGSSDEARQRRALLLTESRRRTRIAADGSLVLLRHQDRTRCDRALIDEGQAIVRACLRRDQPGPYQLQAAINAVHADADSVEETDWSRIVALCDQLLIVAPTPVVALNRAVAVSEVDGPAAALALVDGLDLDGYHPFHATRADLLRRLHRTDEAVNANGMAASLAPTAAERNFLAGQRRQLSSR